MFKILKDKAGKVNVLKSILPEHLVFVDLFASVSGFAVEKRDRSSLTVVNDSSEDFYQQVKLLSEIGEVPSEKAYKQTDLDEVTKQFVEKRVEIVKALSCDLQTAADRCQGFKAVTMDPIEVFGEYDSKYTFTVAEPSEGYENVSKLAETLIKSDGKFMLILPGDHEMTKVLKSSVDNVQFDDQVVFYNYDCDTTHIEKRTEIHKLYRVESQVRKLRKEKELVTKEATWTFPSWATNLGEFWWTFEEQGIEKVMESVEASLNARGDEGMWEVDWWGTWVETINNGASTWNVWADLFDSNGGWVKSEQVTVEVPWSVENDEIAYGESETVYPAYVYLKEGERKEVWVDGGEVHEQAAGGAPEGGEDDEGGESKEDKAAGKSGDQKKKTKIKKFANYKVLKADEGEDNPIVFGVVLEPNDGKDGANFDPDAQGEVYSAEEVEKSAHKFLSEFANLGVMHESLTGNFRVKLLECYTAPVEFTLGEEIVQKGTWLIKAEVVDPILAKAVRDGELTGWSIGGWVSAEPYVE